MDIEFNSIKELYDRVTPALNTKVTELKRNDLDYIKKDDIPYECTEKTDLLTKCFYAMCMAVYLHGKCGEFSAKTYGNSMTRAGMLIDEIRNVLI